MLPVGSSQLSGGLFASPTEVGSPRTPTRCLSGPSEEVDGFYVSDVADNVDRAQGHENIDQQAILIGIRGVAAEVAALGDILDEAAAEALQPDDVTVVAGNEDPVVYGIEDRQTAPDFAASD